MSSFYPAEKFFDMNKKQCKEALDIYKKFLIRMDKVGEFLKVAEVRVPDAWVLKLVIFFIIF